MTLVILLSLFITAPAIAAPAYCEEVAMVLKEAVERGDITYKEANEMLARCARAPDL